MTERNKPDPDRLSQINRFREMARSLGADEDEAAFKAKLSVIARQGPKDEPPAAPQRKSTKRQLSK